MAKVTHNNLEDLTNSLSEDLADFAEVWMRQKKIEEDDSDALFTACICKFFSIGLSTLSKGKRLEMVNYVLAHAETYEDVAKGQ